MQNFFSNMMPGSSQGSGGPHDDVPWWMRYGAKMLGAVGGGGMYWTQAILLKKKLINYSRNMPR